MPLERHPSFLRALVELDEATPPWSAVSAGLAVLRLVDRRLETAGAGHADPWAFSATRQAVARLDARQPVCVVLGGLVELLSDAEVDPDLLAARLFAYGRMLELDSRFALAADVYETVTRCLPPPCGADVSVDAQMRLAYCARMLGRFDQAEQALATAMRLALVLGDRARVLRTRLAIGNLAAARGNLPEAARLLDDTVLAAADPALATVRGMALHDRAVVAARAGALEQAVQLAHEALEVVQAPMQRDRLLSDLATMFADLGARGPARDALLVVVATAQEPYTRWLALVNLLDLAALDGAELVFEQHRRELLAAPLPVELAASFLRTLGEGYQRFGRTAAARRTLEQAVAVAEAHGLHQLQFMAEGSLAALERGQRPAAPRPPTYTDAIRPATATVSDLRALAEVG